MREPRTGKPAPVMFVVEGSSQIPEIILGHREGYRGSGPVPIGNGAATQFQIDIYGELMDSFYLYDKYVSPISYDSWVRVRNRLEWICENWQTPDSGI